MINLTDENGVIKVDNKENPTKLTIELKTGIWTFNAEGMQYKVKKGKA